MAANAAQLELLDEVAHTLDAVEIRFWLRGGWALDFHLGRPTREHADVDLVTWLRHCERIRDLLLGRGFAAVAGYHEPQLVLEKNGQQASFIFVVRRGGRVVVPGYEAWPFIPGSFPDAPKTLGGVSARVLSPESLLHEKLHHEEWSGRPLRAKDRASIELLRTMISGAGIQSAP
jgi:Aminoglycoside-2''-adenylyltransferase